MTLINDLRYLSLIFETLLGNGDLRLALEGEKVSLYAYLKRRSLRAYCASVTMVLQPGTPGSINIGGSPSLPDITIHCTTNIRTM